MKVFLIGGTGYLGRTLATELADHGHRPVALSRSAASRAKVTDSRVTFADGSVEDIDLLVREAAAADAVVYSAVLATSDPQAHTAAVEAILKSYTGTGKAFVLTTSTGVYAASTDPVITPATKPAVGSSDQQWRIDLEETVLTAARAGVRTIVIRPALIYGAGQASPFLTRVMAYIADGNRAVLVGPGTNIVPTVHVNDLARLYVTALEQAPAGSAYTAVGSTVLGLDLAQAMARAVGSGQAPVTLSLDEARNRIGPAAVVLALDLRISQIDPVVRLGWAPQEVSLVSELVAGRVRLP